MDSNPDTQIIPAPSAIDNMVEQVIGRLRTVFDPEIPVNIYELGLIYDIQIQPVDLDFFDVRIVMTLTTPGCPVAGSMPGMVEQTVSELSHLKKVTVDLVWDPPWDKSRMTDAARLQLNMF